MLNGFARSIIGSYFLLSSLSAELLEISIGNSILVSQNFRDNTLDLWTCNLQLLNLDMIQTLDL